MIQQRRKTTAPDGSRLRAAAVGRHFRRRDGDGAVAETEKMMAVVGRRRDAGYAAHIFILSHLQSQLFSSDFSALTRYIGWNEPGL